ncbi:hypothetical protein K6119_02955 [Paracrocinitomix mangrovi]|uniref:hypothetical protein n=1 Tax=Paracrocinitomix mangrovi TaxID=2862509 RepID=UPI001C8F12CF|nr:hypothetical protein [Paracrocinitomix mangrovi]UKN02479.1 hypothetical protein K6119_02955 [Paracrocinitomix mangrovi]
MFFKKKKKNADISGVVKLKPLKYPPKILIGWAEAISGNTDLRDWFLASEQYTELGMAVHAIMLKDDARDWLLQNGYAHLMAMINGVEGNQEALHWLEKNKFHVLKHVALAADGNEDSLKWLTDNNHREFALISQRIKAVKDEIEDDHNDVHKFGRD